MPAVFFLNQVKRLRGTDDVESIFLAIKSKKYARYIPRGYCKDVYPEGIAKIYTQRVLHLVSRFLSYQICISINFRVSKYRCRSNCLKKIPLKFVSTSTLYLLYTTQLFCSTFNKTVLSLIFDETSCVRLAEEMYTYFRAQCWR